MPITDTITAAPVSNHETAYAGKTALHRTAFGTVWFIDTKGNKVTMDSTEANKLFEAVRDGSGEKAEIVHTEGTQAANNLHTNGSGTGNWTRTGAVSW